jgi:cobalt-zinc-cadmium efflux system protein
MSDALGSAGVLVAAGLVTWGWRRADPIIGGAIGLFIIPRTWALLRQGINVLLEGVPPHLDIAEIEQAIRSISGVESVHDLHVWTLTSGRDAMSGHLAVRAGVDTDRIMRDVHETLHQRFGIEHTTLQMEPPRLISLKGGKAR